MTGNIVYKEFFSSRVRSVLAQTEAAKLLTHPGVKGEIIEILLSDLFRPLLPADVGVASGQIVDCYANSPSSQQDVIIYDKSILPPVLYEGSKGLIPIESVLYTIEVKTTLTKSGLLEAHRAAKKLASFSYLPGEVDKYGKEKHHRVELARSVLFALGSDLSGGGISEAERYRDVYADEYPFLRAICVAQKEYWWEVDGSWLCIPAGGNYEETLGFIGGITNTYKRVAASRGWPNLGNYIIETPDNFITLPSGTQKTVEVRCENCGSKAILSVSADLPEVYIAEEGFVSADKCHKCGGELRSVPGLYQLEKGIYVLKEES